jgi:hypothetical protein
MFDDLGTKRFFKDAIPEIVSVIQEFDPTMTEKKFLKIPSFRQVDVLIANLSASLCFYDRARNVAEDYPDLELDDGLNALRANMRTLMDANTIAEATLAANALEARCWALPLEALEAGNEQQRVLIGRAFAAVERIKSVSLDGTYQIKDSRAVEDKFTTIAVPADMDVAVNANTLKKQTLLLLMSMALQERFYNPLYTRGDIKKIILAKLQQSNYWEGATPLLANKTDLTPYPTEIPDYADEVLIRIFDYIDTVPSVYKFFVDNIRQQAIAKRGSGYAPGNNIHYVGGNTFLHLASLGDGQCGFFSMGLLDDGLGAYQLTNSNARQKFLEILANSLDYQTLYDVASMNGVTEWIQKYVEGQNAFLNGPSGQNLVPFLRSVNSEQLKAEIGTLRSERTRRHREIAQELGLFLNARGESTAAAFDALTEEDRSRVRLNTDMYQIREKQVCVRHLLLLLLASPGARRAFSVHALQALAGKLLPDEQPVIDLGKILSSMDCQLLNLQLSFSPGSARYAEVQSAENRMIPLPTQTIAEALGINMQVITTPEVAGQGYMAIDLTADPSRIFSRGLYVLQDILVNQKAKNMAIWNFGGGHYEKLVPLSDPVSLARALRHLSWAGLPGG